MVSITEVSRSNASMADDKLANKVCVFAGATGGIGLYTLQVAVTLLCDSKLYILGRSAARFEKQLQTLREANASNQITFVQTEFSLLGSVEVACEVIAKTESRVDYLYMSPGALPFNGPKFTAEGLDICCALSYYSRMKLLSRLLPLLQQSRSACVLNVLNGGKESPMVEDDLQLQHSWSVMAVVGSNTTMTSLSLDHVAASAENVSFLHAYPGWVKTDIFRELSAPKGAGLARRGVAAFLKCIAWACLTLGGVTAAECGARQAFQLLSGRYGKGSHLVGHDSELVPANSVLEKYRSGVGAAKCGISQKTCSKVWQADGWGNSVTSLRQV